MNLELPIIIIFLIIWILFISYLKIKKDKNLSYLLIFTAFYFYFYKVLDYTLFQYQSLLILKIFNSNLILNGYEDSESLNLMPLITLNTQDFMTSILNILLFVPFGFLLPLISRYSGKKIILLGFLLTIFIELVQLISGQIAGVTFRVADINDIIFNTLGSVLGYTLYVILYRAVGRYKKQNK